MSKQLIKYLFVGMVLGLVLAAYAKPAAAKTEDFYKGATLRIIVPVDPGGGMDLISRALVPHLQKHTGATVVVENMPGAGQLVGAGYLYNITKPDGLTILNCMSVGLILNEILGFEAAKYEMMKFSYIGRMEVVDYLLNTSIASGFKTIQDMQKAPKTIRFATVDPASEITVYQVGLLEAFGLKGKIIPGFKGTKEAFLTLISGKEIDAYVFTAYPEQIKFVKARDVTAVASMMRARLPALPEVSSVLETPGLTAEGKKWLELVITMGECGRMIMAPPGTPEDKRLFLEKALLASLKEPAFIGWMEKRGAKVSALSGEECKALITKIAKMVPPAERPNFKHIFVEKYY